MTSDSDIHEPITVTVTLTCSDFVNFNLRFGLRRARALLFFGAFWLSTAMCGLCSFQLLPQAQPIPINYAYFAPMLVVPVTAFVWLPLSIYIAARRRWHSADELREQRQYSFTDDGVNVTGKTFAAFTMWANIISAGRSGNLIFLGTQQGLFNLIPISAFLGEVELTRFCKLITERVENCQL